MNDVPELLSWLKKRDTWLSDTVQNEIIETMARAIQKQILEKLQDCEFVGVIADGTTDCAGEEQFSICLQFSNKDIQIENCFVGMYNVPDSTGATLASAVKDVLLRFNVPLAKLQGISFDGAANMSGKYEGVQSILKKDCPGSLYVHCSNHSLDLVLQEVSRQIRGFADALLFVRNTANLLRRSSKRKTVFASMFEDEDKVIALSSICPTRWCVRRTAIQKVILSYKAILGTLAQIKADKNNRGEVQSTASGLHKQAMESRTYFFLLSSQAIFGECEAVAKILQGVQVTAKAVMDSIALLQKAILRIRTDTQFQEFLRETEQKTEEYGLTMTRKRQVATPAAIRHDGRKTTEEKLPDAQKWKIQLFEPLDLIQVQLTRRFDQQDLVVAVARENLLLNSELTDTDYATSKLPRNFDWDKLRRQILQLRDMFEVRNEQMVSVVQIAQLLLSLDPLTRSLFSEVKRLVSLIQCQPISAASCERSFSCLRRLKTWLRSTMTQKRFTHLALLSTHRDTVTHLELTPFLNEFCRKTPERASVFG